jgi:LacI family transcriptional regulator
MAKQELKTRRIALAFPNALVASGNLMHGILDYARTRGGWSFTRIPELLSPTAGWLKEWRGDGAFAVVTTLDDAAMLQALSFPVVNVMGFVSQRGLPTATLDHCAIGRLQAEHLIGRRFRRLAYYGVSDLWFSKERLAGFRDVAEASGVHVAPWLVASGVQAPLHLADQQAELSRWLCQIPPPFGVAASNDMRACMVLDACQALGLRVPEEVAVIGVDDDPVVAPFSTPPLTSVARNDRELGLLGAQLLDDLIEGRTPPTLRVLIPPAGVVCRRSTETLAVDSPELHALIQDIRAHIAEPFGVEFLTARAQASRRQLERLILKETGLTPHALINQLRIEHACALLSTPEKGSLTAVAAACGFANLRRFSLVFQQQTGLAPKAFRLQALKTGG